MAQSQVLQLKARRANGKIEDRFVRSVVREMGISENYEGRNTPIRSNISRSSCGTVADRKIVPIVPRNKLNIYGIIRFELIFLSFTLP